MSGCLDKTAGRKADVPRIYNGIAVAGIAVFYFPESYLRSHGKSVKSILVRVDYIGAFLSIIGLTLLLVPPVRRRLLVSTDKICIAWLA